MSAVTFSTNGLWMQYFTLSLRSFCRKYRTIKDGAQTYNFTADKKLLVTIRCSKSFKWMWSNQNTGNMYKIIWSYLNRPYEIVVVWDDWEYGSLQILLYPDLLLTKPKSDMVKSDLYTSLPVRNMTGNERAHARNKSSNFDVLNKEFERAVKILSNKTWLYVHLKYESTNLLLLFVTSNLTWQFNLSHQI